MIEQVTATKGRKRLTLEPNDKRPVLIGSPARGYRISSGRGGRRYISLPEAATLAIGDTEAELKTEAVDRQKLRPASEILAERMDAHRAALAEARDQERETVELEK